MTHQSVTPRMQTFIFANGTMDRWPDGISPLPRPDDRIIAADGGLYHCCRWNWTPHIVIGDMDSVDSRMMASLDPAVTEIIRHPTHKDETDLELALKLAIARQSEDIVILGALGGRWDMTLSNVLLLAADFPDGVTPRIHDGSDVIRCLKGGREIRLTGNPGDRLSLLPLSETVSGLTLEGLSYPLWKATLPMGASRGVSNIFGKDTVRIVLEKGTLLIVTSREKNT